MPDFQYFWAAYPRKRAKLDALKAWKALKPDEETVVAILSAVEWQARSREWQDVQFIPYPASWLRAGRWLDERVSERRNGDRRQEWICGHQPHCGSASICRNLDIINAARREAGKPELGR